LTVSEKNSFITICSVPFKIVSTGSLIKTDSWRLLSYRLCQTMDY